MSTTTKKRFDLSSVLLSALAPAERLSVFHVRNFVLNIKIYKIITTLFLISLLGAPYLFKIHFFCMKRFYSLGYSPAQSFSI